MRWVRLPGAALGAATGAIAIGMVATSTLTTTIILIVTTISTATSIAKAATGSTTRNTEATLPMATGKRRISSAPMPANSLGAELPIARVASGEPVAQEALAELVVRVAQEALAGLVVRVVQEALAGLVVRVVQEALAELVVQEALVELELSQEEAEQALGPVAVAPRTRSAIAAHHRGLVAVPRVEDSAAAAETTRAPVAVEAVRAWEAVE